MENYRRLVRRKNMKKEGNKKRTRIVSREKQRKIEVAERKRLILEKTKRDK